MTCLNTELQIERCAFIERPCHSPQTFYPLLYVHVVNVVILFFFPNYGTDLTFRFQRTVYDVNEGDGTTMVCVEIDPASSQTVEFSVNVGSGSAEEGMLSIPPMCRIN